MNKTDITFTLSADKTIVSRTCPFCGQTHTISIPFSRLTPENLSVGLHIWQDGELIQNALPMLTPEEREFFISGICPKCWDNM